MTESVSRGAAMIAAERERQFVYSGYAPEHDAHRVNNELALAAAAYALHAALRNSYTITAYQDEERPYFWPPRMTWHPESPLRDLVRAGALIAAEIDRRLAAGERLDDGAA